MLSVGMVMVVKIKVQLLNHILCQEQYSQTGIYKHQYKERCIQPLNLETKNQGGYVNLDH